MGNPAFQTPPDYLQREAAALDNDPCPACAAKRVHTAEEWGFHALAGHGFSPETGWTRAEAKAAHEAEKAPKK